MKSYPVFLSIEQKKAVVIGGGKVAEQKITKLIEAGAIVTVVSPTITETLEKKVNANELTWKKRCFSKGDISEAFVVIAATNQPDVNKRVKESCNATQLINIVDDPTIGNFIVPATLRRGKLTIAVSTSGASPLLAKKMISELSNQYDEYYDDYLQFLSEARIKVQKEVANPIERKEILKTLLDPIFIQLTTNGQKKERNHRFEKLLQK